MKSLNTKQYEELIDIYLEEFNGSEKDKLFLKETLMGVTPFLVMLIKNMHEKGMLE